MDCGPNCLLSTRKDSSCILVEHLNTYSNFLMCLVFFLKIIILRDQIWKVGGVSQNTVFSWVHCGTITHALEQFYFINIKNNLYAAWLVLIALIAMIFFHLLKELHHSSQMIGEIVAHLMRWLAVLHRYSSTDLWDLNFKWD